MPTNTLEIINYPCLSSMKSIFQDFLVLNKHNSTQTALTFSRNKYNICKAKSIDLWVKKYYMKTIFRKRNFISSIKKWYPNHLLQSVIDKYAQTYTHTHIFNIKTEVAIMIFYQNSRCQCPKYLIWSWSSNWAANSCSLTSTDTRSLKICRDPDMFTRFAL